MNLFTLHDNYRDKRIITLYTFIEILQGKLFQTIDTC